MILKVTPIAFDSLGTRSMATLVETKDVNIFIDPGVALGPNRYGLPPHPLELEREAQHWQAIKEKVANCTVLIVTHYHYDHHNPGEPDIFRGKLLLIKDPENNINRSQWGRAKYFLENLGNLPDGIERADGKEFRFGTTKIKFSQPVFHGTNSRLGWVIEVLIEENERFLFTSDVEGPSMANQAEFILESDPNIIFCDGPMTYMLGYRYREENLRASIENIKKIIGHTQVKKFILDHHFTRDLHWKERITEIFDCAVSKGVEVSTAAGFIGQKEDLLEARRKELYGK